MNKKLRVYLDTSVISYLEQEDAPDKVRVTRNLWKSLKSGMFDIFISDVVIYELNKCQDPQKRNLLIQHLKEISYTLVNVVDDVNELANTLVARGLLKQKSIDDCRHIATALLNECDYIFSWNFKHIVNLRTIEGVKEIALEQGRKNVLIYSPEAFEEDN